MRCYRLGRIYKKSTDLEQLKRLWLFKNRTTKRPHQARTKSQRILVVLKTDIGCSNLILDFDFERLKNPSSGPLFGAYKPAPVLCLGDRRPYGENRASAVMFCHVGEYEQNAMH